MDKDMLKIAFDDARARQSALLSVIYFVESQAMNLLRLLITVGIATVAAFAAGVQSDNQLIATLCPAALVGIAFSTVGAAYCFRAMRTATLNLPGRGPDFWLWVLDRPTIPSEEHFRYYLEDLQKDQQKTREVNATNAYDYEQAKKVAVATPPAMLITAVATYFLS